MRHYYLDVGIAGQHIAAYHVRDGTSSLRKILLHGKRCLLHDLTIDWLWTMGVQDDYSLTLIEEREERVEFWHSEMAVYPWR